MSGLIPMAMFGIEVPSGDVAVPAGMEIPAAFRITMAAIDPSEELEEGEAPRATLKVIRQPLDFDDEDDSDEDDSAEFDPDEMDRILAGEDEDEDDSDDEEVNGGPSDPSKSTKAQLIAKIKQLQAEEDLDMEDDDDDLPNGINGMSAKAKGKLPAGSDDDLDLEDDEDDEDDDIEEFVICTLDPSKSYQQPLDITFGEREMVYFKVSGGYSVHLTGNYVEPQEDRSRLYDPEDDEDEEYDLEPDSDELDDMDEDDEEDELDDLEDPRIAEVDDEDEAPALIKAVKSKDSKKRSAPEDDTPETLDDLMAAQKTAVNGEQKLSKKQLKKLKKNDGSALAVEKETEAPASNKSDKKVQFAKELEQGPTPTKDGKAAKGSLGPKVVQGVTIDDKKLGKGPAAKNGDRVGMRYIGKLESNNAVFDSNKKGKPFTFKLGSGEVIKGWDVGIAGMSIGGERRVTVPAHMAYGSKGAPPAIPPNATLVFDVKLIDLNKGK